MAKHNKYAKEVLFNTKLMKLLFVLILILNLILPVYKTTQGFKSGFQYLILIFHAYGMCHALGYFEGQSVPIIQIGIVRLFQVLCRTLIHNNPIAWKYYAILFTLDCIMIFVQLTDKANYVYEYIGEDD